MIFPIELLIYCKDNNNLGGGGSFYPSDTPGRTLFLARKVTGSFVGEVIKD